MLFHNIDIYSHVKHWKLLGHYKTNFPWQHSKGVYFSPQGQSWTQPQGQHRLELPAPHPPELACISQRWSISRSFSSPLETQPAQKELFAVHWGVAFPAHPQVWTNTAPELPCHQAHVCFVGVFWLCCHSPHPCQCSHSMTADNLEALIEGFIALLITVKPFLISLWFTVCCSLLLQPLCILQAPAASPPWPLILSILPGP